MGTRVVGTTIGPDAPLVEAKFPWRSAAVISGSVGSAAGSIVVTGMPAFLKRSSVCGRRNKAHQNVAGPLSESIDSRRAFLRSSRSARIISRARAAAGRVSTSANNSFPRPVRGLLRSSSTSEASVASLFKTPGAESFQHTGMSDTLPTGFSLEEYQTRPHTPKQLLSQMERRASMGSRLEARQCGGGNVDWPVLLSKLHAPSCGKKTSSAALAILPAPWVSTCSAAEIACSLAFAESPSRRFCLATQLFRRRLGAA